MNSPADVADADAERPSSPFSGVTPDPARPTPRWLVVGSGVAAGVGIVVAVLALRWWILHNLDKLPRRVAALRAGFADR